MTTVASPSQWKICSACQRRLPAADYKQNAASKDGLYTYCKLCEKERRITAKADLSDMADILSTTKPAGIPAHVLNGVKIPSSVENPTHGVWTWLTPKNWRVVAVHYSADPTKRPGTEAGDAWIARKKEDASTRDWQREMEIDFTISEGDPFFTRFNRGVHVKALSYDPTLPIIRGWDFGRGHPSCLALGTKVLRQDLQWVPVEQLVAGDGLLAFDEFPATTGAGGRSRCWKRASVTGAHRVMKPCLRVTMEDGTVFTASTDHHFLCLGRTHTGGRSRRNTWKMATELSIGDRLPKFFEQWASSNSYEDGWIAGFYDGEGSLSRSSGGGFRLDISQVFNGLLDRLVPELSRNKFEVARNRIRELRPNQQDTEKVTLLGGWPEIIRFLGMYRPSRLLEKFLKIIEAAGPHMRSFANVTVARIEEVGEQEVVVLETSTRTYIAEGFGHHNCVWAQKLKNGQLRILRSVIETQKDIFAFAPYIISETQMRWPGAEIIDCGDPAGAQETDKGATTHILLVEFKINLHYRWSSNEEGWKMMEKSLIVREDGEPGILLDPRENEDLIDGFAGGYKLDTGKTGRDTEGRLKNSALKDGWYEHVMDALRYIYIHCFKIDGKAANALEKSTLWMTNAEVKKKIEEFDNDGVGEFFS